MSTTMSGTGRPAWLGPIGAAHDRAFGWAGAHADGALGLGARLAFLLVLAPYYLNAALTKVGEGFPGALLPSDGAYVQILPAAMERAGYDRTQIGPLGDAVVLAGTYAEFVLPVLIVLGLLSRLAALGMIGFVLVQSYVDVAFHGADAATVGAWLDRLPDAAILDQRLLWVFVLATIVLRGGGWLSLDRLIASRR